MIKIICLTTLPVLMVLFYPQPPLEPEAAREAQVRLQDRRFLAELDAQAAASTRQTDRADREFLATLQDHDPIPKNLPVKPAVAMRAPLPAQVSAPAMVDGVPVRRAIPVEPGLSVPRATLVRPAATPAIAAVSDTRALLKRPAITQIEPIGSADPSATGPRRASILISRDEIIMTPGTRVQ